MPTGRVYTIGLSVLLLASGTAVAGPDWVEHGDAGSTLSTAQQTLGSGPINFISGTLGGTGLGLDQEDMYLVRVVDPASFSLSIVSADFSAQIWVFNVTLPGEAFGLLANQGTTDGSPTVTSMATDGTGAQLTLPGVYAIAISGLGRVPVSRTGPIFTFQNPTEISGPDGPGGFNPHQGWIGQGQVGGYTIHTVGVGFYDVPAPASGALLAAGAIFASRRRRR
jgi:hypothetical protein